MPSSGGGGDGGPIRVSALVEPGALGRGPGTVAGAPGEYRPRAGSVHGERPAAPVAGARGGGATTGAAGWGWWGRGRAEGVPFRRPCVFSRGP